MAFTLHLRADDSFSKIVMNAIRAGDLDSLSLLLVGIPGLPDARIEDGRGVSRTLLHVATDWPGFFPNGPAVVAALIEAGCDPNARVEGCRHSETALHWAASSDDVEVARALIDGGADMEARGASIAGGTPLDDAVGYGCWRVARLLVERGARVEKLWQAAGLGMISRAKEFFAADPPPTAQEVTDAFWQACHGGERRMAEYLLAQGADLNGTPSWGGKRPLDIAACLDTGREALLTLLRERGVKSSRV